jgi:hypothetical protein
MLALLVCDGESKIRRDWHELEAHVSDVGIRSDPVTCKRLELTANLGQKVLDANAY